jgi:hypothetical protein
MAEAGFGCLGWGVSIYYGICFGEFASHLIIKFPPTNGKLGQMEISQVLRGAVETGSREIGFPVS